MITAFKDQLEVLSTEQKAMFHELVRKRIGKRATAILEKRLKEMILFMPTLIQMAFSKWSYDDSPKKAKKLVGFMLTYLYHPKDFLAEEEYGLFGYLDDAYFVSIVYEEVLKAISSENGGLKPSDQGILEKITKLKQAARIVLPKETSKIDTMIQEIASGNQTTFSKIFDS